jgi:hypothetical protein
LVESNKYAFKTKDGKLNLPIGNEAELILVGEKDGKFLYNRKRLLISQNMLIAMDAIVTTPKAMNADIAALGWKDLDIKAGAAKNAGAIQDVAYKITELEKLHPSIQCDCAPKDVQAPENRDTLVEFSSIK